MSTAAGTVVVVGSVNLDLVLRVEELPAPGATTHSRSLDESTGGKGAQLEAVAAAAAGAPTRMVGAVGAHYVGPRILDDLAARGVDVSGVRLLEGVATGRAVVTVDAHGENSIVVSAGANGEVRGDAVERALAGLGPSDVVVLQNEISVEATAAAARAARDHGARVVWNAAPALPDTPKSSTTSTCSSSTRGNSARSPGTSASTQSSGPAVVAAVGTAVGAGVICTLGALGSQFAIGWETGTVPAPAVRVVDTTGAGDTFVGYICAQWAMGGEASVVERIELATAAAALAVTRPGSAAAIPSRSAWKNSRCPVRAASTERTTG